MFDKVLNTYLFRIFLFCFFIYLFIYLFIHLFIYSFIHLFIFFLLTEIYLKLQELEK